MSIRLEQVSVHPGDRAPLRDCTLAVAEGEHCALLGPEGSGKASLLRVIVGTLPVDHGRVLLFGRDVTRVPARQRSVGIVYREPALFNRMTLLGNVEFALGLRVSSEALRRLQAEELLALIGLTNLAARHPAQVSAAERYRTAVARALGHDARILLLEAPTAGFAPRELRDLHATLERVRQRFGSTVLFATSDPEAAMRLGDTIGVMSAGRVLEVGDPESLYLRPRTRSAARAVGIANLLPGQAGREGVRLGEQRFPPGGTARLRSVAGEVTVLVRPEDIALADSPADLPVPMAGSGLIERIEFAGLVQRLHVTGHTLSPGTDLTGGASTPRLVASRPARTAQERPLMAGHRVAIGIRRIHVLPTQLCSLWISDAGGGDAESLARRRTVLELSASMQAAPRPVGLTPPGIDLPATGLCVVAGWGARGMEAAARLLERGARQVLLLREADRPATQMLMFAQSSRAAREHMLSIGASVLRYLPMEAVFLVPDLRRRIRGGRYRMLLELRRTALEHHGIDVRTELAGGDPDADLAARLRRAEGQVLLVLGLSSPRTARHVFDTLGAAFGTARQLGGVLVTCARRELRSPAMVVPTGQLDVA